MFLFAIKTVAFVTFLFFSTETAFAFYDPGTQRWLNRDPLGEPGFEITREYEPDVLADGQNLYRFVGNAPTIRIDGLGLIDIPPTWGLSIPPNIPENGGLEKAVRNYVSACKCGESPTDFDCHTICDAFYSNVSTILVANCIASCSDCNLGKYTKDHKPAGKKIKKK